MSQGSVLLVDDDELVLQGLAYGAAVDRVRAEIATMRTSADLEHVTPLLWEELTGLGVSFARCGVYIVDDEAQQVDAYPDLNPQGAALEALRLAFGSHAHVGRLVDHWRAQAPHSEQWDRPLRAGCTFSRSRGRPSNRSSTRTPKRHPRP
jgi:hypothetical protein